MTELDLLEPGTDTRPPPRLRDVAFQGGLWAAASQVVPAAGTAVLSVAAGRYLGTAALGQQSLIAYVNAAVAAVLVVALNTTLLQVGGRLQGAGSALLLRRLVRWAIVAHLAAGLAVFAMMAALGLGLGQNRVSWVIIGAVSVLDALADALAVRLILTEGWAPVGRLRLVFQLVGPVLGLVLLFHGYGIAGIFFGDGIAALGLLIAVAVRYRRLAPPTVAGEPSLGVTMRPPVAVLRTFSLFALDAGVTQIVAKRIEFVALAVFATSTAIGQYSVAFMAVSLIAMVPYGLATAALPLIARASGSGEVDRAVYHLRFALRLGTAVCIPVVALLAALGPAAVIAVYGTRYETAARLVPVASLTLLVAAICGLCAQFWAGRGQLGVVLTAGAVAAVVDIAVAVVVVPLWSSFGAVVANLAAQLVLAVVLLRATVRRVGAIGWRGDGLLRMAIAAGVGAILASAVRIAASGLPVGPEPRAVLTLVVGALVGLSSVWLTGRIVGLFDAAEAEWLGSLLPSRLARFVDRLVVAGARS